MPIRRRSAHRSTRTRASAATLATIAPTVRHATRINACTALFDVRTASHATWSSTRRCARRGAGPTAPRSPSARVRGSPPAARRPPQRPGPPPGPAPATAAVPHPGHTTAPADHTGRSAAGRPYSGTHAPPAHRPRRRSRPAPQPSVRHPTTPAIHWQNARRTPTPGSGPSPVSKPSRSTACACYDLRNPPTDMSGEPEKSQIQALDRSAWVLPMMPGMPERRTHDYLRHGITTLFAVDPSVGERHPHLDQPVEHRPLMSARELPCVNPPS